MVRRWGFLGGRRAQLQYPVLYLFFSFFYGSWWRGCDVCLVGEGWRWSSCWWLLQLQLKSAPAALPNPCSPPGSRTRRNDAKTYGQGQGPSWLDVRPCLWLCGSNVAGSAKRSEILPRHPAKIYWQRLAARRAQAHPTSTYRVPAPSAICHLPTLDPFPPPSPTIPYSVYVPRFLTQL